MTTPYCHKFVNGVASPGIALAFQSSYRTFSPAQFVATFNGKGFTKTHVTAQISAEPNAQPVPTAMYSKGGLIVVLNDSENMVQFHILNTLNAGNHMREVMDILGSLNFEPPSIASMTAGITATVKTDRSPISGLTGLVNQKLVDRVQRAYGDSGDILVTSIRLAMLHSRDESLTVTIEPFGNDPEGAYYVDVKYATKAVEKFNAFMAKVGDEMFRDLVAGVKDNG